MNDEGTTDFEKLQEAELHEKYPLHFAIFENDLQKLKIELNSRSNDKSFLNLLDIHGRSPVMLATMLGHLECAEELLENGADANTQNRGEKRKVICLEMWSLSHEAILWKNHNFLKKVLAHRDYQRAIQTIAVLQQLNKSLQDSSDFFVEMRWEFTSWLPFVKNMCPSDTYKIYKCGTNVRIDANMLEIGRAENGLNNRQQSFIFRFVSDAVAEVIFVDPNEQIAYVQMMDLRSEPCFEDFIPDDNVVAEKFRSPTTTTYVNVDKVDFERTKSSGLLSWIGSSCKEEDVEGFTCRLMNASNVEIVTKTRLDHLSIEDREEAEKEASSNKTLSLLMSLFEKKRIMNNSLPENASNGTAGDVYGGISAFEYLSKKADNCHIGKRCEEQIKSNAFNASLWLSETFPLKLHEQIFPVIDLMAVRNAKFSRLKSFIQLQLPSGFPVRIKIPIFHLINAQITFRNVNDPSEEAIEENVVEQEDENEPQTLRLRQSLFQIPNGFELCALSGSFLFSRAGQVEQRTLRGSADQRYRAVDVEDEYVYLLGRFVESDSQQTSSNYEQQLQRAIEESLTTNSEQNAQSVEPQMDQEADDELLKALELSKAEERRRQEELEEEEELLRKALELSMVEK